MNKAEDELEKADDKLEELSTARSSDVLNRVGRDTLIVDREKSFVIQDRYGGSRITVLSE